MEKQKPDVEKNMKRKFLSIILIFALILPAAAPCLAEEDAVYYAPEGAHLSFGEEGISEISKGSGYEISGTDLSVSAPGTYRISGSCG